MSSWYILDVLTEITEISHTITKKEEEKRGGGGAMGGGGGTCFDEITAVLIPILSPCSFVKALPTQSCCPLVVLAEITDISHHMTKKKKKGGGGGGRFRWNNCSLYSHLVTLQICESIAHTFLLPPAWSVKPGYASWESWSSSRYHFLETLNNICDPTEV